MHRRLNLWRHVALASAIGGFGTAMALGAATRGTPATTRGGTGTSRGTATAASVPASRPATATPKAPVALPADAILKFFPANANSLSSRSDARNFTVEGR